MSQRVLKILRRHEKSIGCVFTGNLMTSINPLKIEQLLDQIQQIGSIRKNIVIFDQQLSSEIHVMFISKGISPIIVPSNSDIHLTLEVLDILNSQNMDVICIGIDDDSLLPVVIAAREKVEVLLVCPSKEDVKNYTPYIDYLITLKDLPDNKK
jgi:uncharacterized protein (TIGR00288 family)